MTPWQPDTVLAFAKQHLHEPFRSSDVCIAASRHLGEWSRGQGILAALRRFGLVRRTLIVDRPGAPPPNGRSHYEYWFVDQTQAEAEQATDAAEARRLLGIDEAVIDYDPSGYGWGV